jgi:hypothetical protein
MNRVIVFVLAAILLVGIGFGLAKLIQTEPPAQEHEYQLALSIRATGDFAVAISPSEELDVAKGTPAIWTLTASAIDGYDAKVYYDLAGMPEGSVTFSKNPAEIGEAVTLTIATIDLMSNSTYVLSLGARAY